MKRSLLILFSIIWTLLPAYATLLRCIDTSDGLSSKRIIGIEKDLKGYMWFLTHEGADRYDGKNLTHYPLIANNQHIRPVSGSNTFLKGNNGTLWQVGSDGNLFQYSIQKDEFLLIHEFPAQNIAETNAPVSTGFIDSSHQIWYFEGGKIHIYQTNQKQEFILEGPSKEIPSAIAEAEKELYYIACQNGITLARWTNNELIYDALPQLKGIEDPSHLYFDQEHQILVIGTLNHGIYLYNRQTKEVKNILHQSNNIHINKVCKNLQNKSELLLATNGAGIFKLDLKRNLLKQAIERDDATTEQLKRSVVRDLYYDQNGKLWIASYLRGVFVYTSDAPTHQWMTHLPNNSQSLCNNHVTRIIEDSEGDIWYSTFDGVSCYFTKTNEWKHVSMPRDVIPSFGNHLILSLHETEPGKILAGGYMSKLYTIDKKNMSFSETAWYKPYEPLGHPGHYIRSIIKDQEGFIWTGGFPYLIGYHPERKESVQIQLNQPIYYLAEKDSSSLWIGTRNGLFMLNKKENQRVVALDGLDELGHIHHIYQDKKNLVTYIATQNQGLISYNNVTKKIRQYTEENSALNSNRVYCILSNEREELFLTTEEGVTCFHTKGQLFTNWEEEQGLGSTSFSQAAGVHTTKGELIFGSINGALQLSDSTSFAKKEQTKLVFKDLYLSYERTVPGDPESPLTQHIDDTESISLNQAHSIFSIEVGSVNFDTPSSILYSWKLDNFYEKWSTPTTRTRIRYMNLKPGDYKLRIRAISKENGHILEERHLNINIKKTFWSSWKGYIINLLCLLLISLLLLRFFSIKREGKKAKEKIRLFINSAEEIHTPLTLIKTPLQELLDKESLTDWGRRQLQLVIQSTDNLADMAKSFINFDEEEVEGAPLYVNKYELDNYLTSCIKPLQLILEKKQINLQHIRNEKQAEVWINKQKVDYIVRSLLLNTIKLTARREELELSTQIDETTWRLIIKSRQKSEEKEEQKPLGITILRKFLAKEKKIRKGAAMQLTYKLVKRHEGTIEFVNKREKELLIVLTLPLKGAYYTNEMLATNQFIPQEIITKMTALEAEHSNLTKREGKPTILLIENNEELRQIISDSLKQEYNLWEVSSSFEAFKLLEEKEPDLVLSDIMLPELDGYSICKEIKENERTKQIPVVLLTNEGDTKGLITALLNNVDKCIVKPFDVPLLKACISNVLHNKKILQSASTKTNSTEEVVKEKEYSSDELFLLKVTKIIEEHIDKELNIDQLCHAMLISRTSFYTKMKALTNQSPREFIRQIKMNKAEELLKSKHYTVSEIADMLGFSDPKYFTDIFKKHAGVTPSSFMKQN